MRTTLDIDDDVVAAARRTPGRLNLGAVNPGSTQNLSAHLLKQVGELDVTIVPYKTTPDLITAILRNDVDVGFDFYAGLQPVIVDNKVRIVATSGEQRNPTPIPPTWAVTATFNSTHFAHTGS